MGDQKFVISSSSVLQKASLSRWYRLHLQSCAPTNPHWACVVGYGPFSFCVIPKEGLCPSSEVINGLMMMMMIYYPYITSKIYRRRCSVYKLEFISQIFVSKIDFLEINIINLWREIKEFSLSLDFKKAYRCEMIFVTCAVTLWSTALVLNYIYVSN
jgi:hypothetical protein